MLTHQLACINNSHSSQITHVIQLSNNMPIKHIDNFSPSTKPGLHKAVPLQAVDCPRMVPITHFVGLRVEYPIWSEHKCSGIYNFYPLTHQGSHAFHKNRRKGKRNLPLVDRFVKPSKSAPWFIRIFKGAAFLKNDHPLQVSTHEQIMNDLSEC